MNTILSIVVYNLIISSFEKYIIASKQILIKQIKYLLISPNVKVIVA